MHGYPDYGLAQPRATVYPVTDLSEAVARLESIVTFDRRGDVVYLDSFEAGLAGCFGTLYGLGAVIDIQVGKARNGGCCAKLTTGSTLGRAARLERLQPYPALSNMGFEFSFTVPVDTQSVEISLGTRAVGTVYQGAVIYDPVGENLFYRDVAGVIQLIASSVETYTSDYCFNTIKLVVDFMTNTYVRVIVNDQSFDLTGLAVWTYAFAGSPILDCFAYVDGVAATNAVYYIDDFIITQNEPA